MTADRRAALAAVWPPTAHDARAAGHERRSPLRDSGVLCGMLRRLPARGAALPRCLVPFVAVPGRQASTPPNAARRPTPLRYRRWAARTRNQKPGVREASRTRQKPVHALSQRHGRQERKTLRCVPLLRAAGRASKRQRLQSSTPVSSAVNAAAVARAGFWDRAAVRMPRPSRV
jgi:hypothetical protein